MRDVKIDSFYNGVTLFRRKKALIAQFLCPHLVISTSLAAGGIQRGMEYAVNSQICEGTNHNRDINYRDMQAFRRFVCEPLGLPPKTTVLMATAANMHHAAIGYKNFEGLEVVAVATGGVETNAGRAGDPASVLETAEGFVRLDADGRRQQGTINIMLLISNPLTEAALTRAIVTATEAKTAALQELAINSRYSSGLATGTGTDQIIIAAAEPQQDLYPLSWAGKHGKLGELIGRAVIAAVKKTLARQNGITPGGQCAAKIHLERFGCDTASMKEGICSYLPEKTAQLLRQNFQAINHDPLVVAAVAALAHLQDKSRWGILPQSCLAEILGAGAAQLACSIGGRYDKMALYRQQLGEESAGDFLSLCWRAFSLGFADKWPE